MKVHELMELLARADQDAEVFSITGHGYPLQVELRKVETRKDFAARHTEVNEYDVLKARMAAASKNAVFFLQGEMIGIWKPNDA